MNYINVTNILGQFSEGIQVLRFHFKFLRIGDQSLQSSECLQTRDSYVIKSM